MGDIRNHIDSENWVFVKDEKVVGYIFGWIIQNEFHLHNIAVHPNYRRQKIGQTLINYIISRIAAQRVNFIFLSAIFSSKKTKNFLGIKKFNNLSNYTKKKIICLGGIKKNNLNKIKLLNAYGFSSVSLFEENIKYIRI